MADKLPSPDHNGQLKAIVERIENLEVSKAEIASDIREVYLEAKSNGYDPKALREVIRFRRQEREKRETHAAIVETYLLALGDLAGTPLGRAATTRDLKIQPDDLPPVGAGNRASTADRPFGIGEG